MIEYPFQYPFKYPFADSLFSMVYQRARSMPQKQLEILKAEASDECWVVTEEERKHLKASADFLKRMVEAGLLDLSQKDDIDKIYSLAKRH